jgi:uncharacterized protein (DUF58 family)
VQEILARIRRLEIRTRKAVAELTAGAYHSVFKGRGMEFHEVREYVAGDDVRAIDWNVTARLNRPFLKQYAEERELAVLLVVDVSASGDFGSTGRSKNEVAAELAATLAFSAIRNGDRVGLLLYTDGEELFIPPRKGRRHVLRLIRDLLYHERRGHGTNLRGALEQVMRLARRRTVVFLISDMLDEGYGRALAVAARRHDLTGIRILDPHELSLPPAGPVHLEDAETGELLTLTLAGPARLQELALEAAALRLEQDRIFREAGVDLIDVTCGQDPIRPLMRYFHTREKRR